ncbi:MAG: cinA [Herbinix sp.]|jgi:nicotinamide-nucleotide amidase|nr:cinA [Herbinix sp.]
MKAELISVGTELLLGNIVNTNAQYLSRRCAELGFSVYYQMTVGDNENRLCDIIRTALTRSEIIILTGGLGPTQDDLTKEAVAKVLERNLLPDEHSRQRILSYFMKRFGLKEGEPIPSDVMTKISQNNWKQALIIENSIVIDNDNGTAPGTIIKIDGKSIVLLPGPPNEMIPMFDEKIMPYLKGLQSNVLFSRMIKICGIGESMAETMILDLIENQSNPTIAPYAKDSEVHLRVTASAQTIEEAEALTLPIVCELKRRFQDNIYTTEEKDHLEDVVVQLLKEKNFTLATAESCTGGLLTGKLVNVSGVSSILKEGYITYSNEAKSKNLFVKSETLKKYGAVSEVTAAEMAQGAAKAAKAEAAIAITGIAGPEGGTNEKPVGLVYIACYLKGTITVKECRFQGNRQKVRDQSVIYGLDLLRRCLIQQN